MKSTLKVNLVACVLLCAAVPVWGGTVVFDGANDYVTTPNLRPFFTNETVTIEAWFNASAAGVLVDELGGLSAPPWHGSLMEVVTTGAPAGKGEVRLRVWPLDVAHCLSLGFVDLGTWNHVALRYDKSSLNLDGFLNGVPSSNSVSVDRVAPWESGFQLYYALGLNETSNIGSGAMFKGMLDEVRIWNIRRNDADLQSGGKRSLSGAEPGLVAYYRFDDGVGLVAVDSSSSGNHASLNGGVLWSLANSPVSGASFVLTEPPQPVTATGAALSAFVSSNLDLNVAFEYGPEVSCLSFDGTAQYVHVPGFGTNAPTDEITIEFWQKANAIRGQHTLSMSTGLGPGAGKINAYVPWTDGNVYWDFSSGRLMYRPPVSIIGTWQHFAFTASKSGNYMRVYRNGVLEAQQTGMTSFTRQPADLFIGGSGGERFGGQLSEMRVWGKARSSQEIQADMYRSLSGHEANLVAYWRMNEGSGVVAANSTTNHLDGLLVNLPFAEMWTASSRPNYGATIGGAGWTPARRALQLEGLGAYVDVPAGAWFTGGDFTVEAWVNPQSYSTWGRIVDFSNGPDSDNVILTLSDGSSGAPSGYFRQGAVNVGAVVAPGPLPLNIWTHVAWTYQAGSLVLYTNGAPVATATSTTGTGPRNLSRALNYIGRSAWPSDAPANAQFADVRIWSVARTADQIRAGMGNSVVPDERGLSAWWRLNEAGGTDILDSSSQGRNATLVNGGQRVDYSRTSVTLGSLPVGTTWHYRAVLSDTNGYKAYGQDQAFTTVNAASGNTLTLDGVDDSVHVPASVIPSNGDFTVEAWALLPGLPMPWTARQIVAQGSAGNAFSIGWHEDRTIQVGEGWPSTGVPFPVGQWTHIAVVKTASDTRLYTNGLPARAKNSSIPNPAASGAFEIGRSFAALGFWPGQIDEVRVWNRALDDSRILQNFNRRLIGDEANLVALFRFDEGSGGLAVDSSPSHKNGLLNGGVVRTDSKAGLGLPSAQTQPASALAEDQATLNGTLYTGGGETRAWFEWGTNAALSATTENVAIYYNIGQPMSSLAPILSGRDTRQPAAVGTFTNIDWNWGVGSAWPGGPVEYFGARYNAQLWIPRDGWYTFYLASDDGSELYLDGSLIVNNDGLHGAVADVAGAAVSLATGPHSLEVFEFENTGNAQLRVSWSGPGLPKQTIPASAFATPVPLWQDRTAVQTFSASSVPVAVALTNLWPGPHYYRLVAANANGTNYGVVQKFEVYTPAALTALCFDGKDDYVLTPNLQSLFTNDTVTLEVWFNANSQGVIIDERGASDLPGSYYDSNIEVVGENAEVRARVYSPDASPTKYVVLGTASYGAWNHAVLRYDRSTKRLDGFLNGVKSSQSMILDRAAPFTPPRTYGLFYGIGLSDVATIGSGLPFNGLIDEFRVWNVARTDEEIIDNYRRRLIGNEAGLVAYYRFDDASGFAAQDSSGNGNTAGLYTSRNTVAKVGDGPAWVSSAALASYPSVKTLAALPVQAKRATLRGTVNPGGLNTWARFEWGMTSGYGHLTEPSQMVGAGISTVPVEQVLSGLDPGTVYHYRMRAWNDTGEAVGEDQTFTTLAVGVGWPVATRMSQWSLASAARHTVDAAGNVYLAGQFSFVPASAGATLYGKGATNLPFVSKISPRGDWMWLTNALSASNSMVRIQAIAVDRNTNLYVGGQYWGTNRFGDHWLYSTNRTNGFLAKLSAWGGWLWAVGFGGTGPDCVNAIATGTNGNVFVAGQFCGTSATFGTFAGSSVGGADLFVGMLTNSGEWSWVRTAGTSADGETALGLGVDASERVFVTGRFSGSGVFGLSAVGGSDLFVASFDHTGALRNARSGGGSGNDVGTALALDGSGNVYLAGRFAGVGSYDGSASLSSGTGTNLFVMRLDPSLRLSWFSSGPGVECSSLAANNDYVYVTGDYQLPVVFGETTLSSAGATDIYVAQLPATVIGTANRWSWAKSIGDLGVESSGSVSVDSTGDVLVSGSFQNTLAMGYVSLSVLERQDLFVARLRPSGVYEHNTWIVGQAIPTPAEAKDEFDRPYGPPSWTILDKQGLQDTTEFNTFAWSDSEQRLYPYRPVTVMIKWPTSATGPTNLPTMITAVGDCVWPDSPQIHIAGTPAELEPATVGFPFKFLGQVYPANQGPTVDVATPVFQATEPGYSVLQFLKTEAGGAQSFAFEVVKTIRWTDFPSLATETVEVGRKIVRAGHNDPTGKTGFVLFENALYDGSGPNRAHIRETRTGPILPVNTSVNGTNAPLVVVWYHTNQNTGIAWPDEPVRYQGVWPQNPARLVIASQLGYGPSDATQTPGAYVYSQPDPSQPGYNPNEEHALLIGDTLYALRTDLNALGGSEPYVLVKYHGPNRGEWQMEVVKVEAEDEHYKFEYTAVAGEEIQPPKPLRFMDVCLTNTGVAGPYYQDYKGRIHARAADPGTDIVVHWYYPLQESFFYDLHGSGSNDVAVGSFIPWLDRRPPATPGVPLDVVYKVAWPPVNSLQVGQNLFNPKNGLPGIRKWASASVIYDQANPSDTNAINSLVRMYDPISERVIQLRPSGSTNYLTTEGYTVFEVASDFDLLAGLRTAKVKDRVVFIDLPYSIRSRLTFDPLNQNLCFSGLLDESADAGGPGDPLLLVNVMTVAERDRIKLLDGDQPVGAETVFDKVVGALFDLTRNPNHLDLDGNGVADQAWLVGLAYGYTTNRQSQKVTTHIVHEPFDDRDKLLTAAPGTGSGYVTLVQNDDPNLPGLPVSLSVLRIEGGPYLGDLKVLKSDDLFDERLTIRHSADFGGAPENLQFEWYYQSASSPEVRTNLPYSEEGELNLNGWTLLKQGRGLNDITFGDGGTSSRLTLFDNYVICRYRGYAIGGSTNWSDWIGVDGGGQAQLAPGWVKRVILGLNPFEARTKDFHESPTATYASMIQQAGGRYEGDIAFNPSADNLNSVGLLAAYETVLRRARRLSIDGSEQIDDSAVNQALLLAAGRISEFYVLLGNEAFADAADPTIGFRTDQAGYGALAPCIFTFQNQLDSLLEEELALLRGRDDRSATVRHEPVYNRLFWNFTKNDGEVAYSQTYNISDQNGDGRVDAEDARIMFPQGHGDAWGHYLSATKTYYSLLRSQYYTWLPRTEDILLASVPVEVSYRDERKFAGAASAKAKAGAEIVDLTYRQSYVDDPSGQYQGYKDTNLDRAWGLSEWARRAGQGAYFDWVTANAILPATDPDAAHAGIQKIDRTTVQELGEIVAAYNTVQSQLDKADAGLNPLGLAKNVVPFDIDPTLISRGETHFEQIYDRALGNMQNALTVFNHANQMSQSLRALQDTVDTFAASAQQQELDYKNRMIEIFGYPYAGDIGPAGTYPSGYDGPDLYHYMYVNTVELNGDTAPPSQTFTGFFTSIANINHAEPDGVNHFWFPDYPTGDPGDRLRGPTLQVTYPFSPSDFGFVAPSGWGQRRAPGELQQSLSAMVQAHARLQRANLAYDNLLKKIQDMIDLLQDRYNVQSNKLQLTYSADQVNLALTTMIKSADLARRFFTRASERTAKISEITCESFPKVVGLATDAFSAARSSVKAVAFAGTWVLDASALAAEVVSEGMTFAKERNQRSTDLQIAAQGFTYEVQQQFKLLEDLLRQEAVLRVEAFELTQALEQSSGRYQAALAKGLRLAEERAAFRARIAAQTQENRYRDMTFRIFRNDAIQKYRAQFDLAAQYVFLAATAYDFETQLLGGDNGAGREFLTDIIRQRSLGEMDNGSPIAGRHGLADPLARLGMNFSVLKGQMGFNNPQTETGRFSLRNELLRLGNASDADWRAELEKCKVANLWDVPEFRRYCRPFAPESTNMQPGLVIRFPTTVTFGLNFFGKPLGGGDSAYDASLFATKVRSVGVWFSDYSGTGLSMTPRVYLVPAGQDIMRSPSGKNMETREWRVVDQKIPVPFPIGVSSLQSSSWIPSMDSLSDTMADIRRFSSFRAYHDAGQFNPDETSADSRLIGRSVWNTDWVLIIPGGTFLFDADRGLSTFIASVSDIKLFFQTYSYSGD